MGIHVTGGSSRLVMPSVSRTVDKLMTTNHPWISGPAELLQHGLKLLLEDSDLNRRLALIAIDNAVELTIRTYLSLPRRITGVGLSRKGYEEIADSFPRLLDALEAPAVDRLAGVDLGDIEWYHRLRNQLYHQGSGLTVEREKVEVYASMAMLLFKNLFGIELQAPPTPDTDRIGRFLTAWIEIERVLQASTLQHGRPVRALTFPLETADSLPPALKEPNAVAELNKLRQVRNTVVHQGYIPSDREVQLLERWARDIKASSRE